MAAIPELTSASLKKGLYALSNETLGGLTAPFTFKQGQPNLNNYYFVWGIKGGKFAIPTMTPVKVPDAPISAIIKALTK